MISQKQQEAKSVAPLSVFPEVKNPGLYSAYFLDIAYNLQKKNRRVVIGEIKQCAALKGLHPL